MLLHLRLTCVVFCQNPFHQSYQIGPQYPTFELLLESFPRQPWGRQPVDQGDMRGHTHAGVGAPDVAVQSAPDGAADND
jgi:hypothetical protein